jgi:hypothetical protein
MKSRTQNQHIIFIFSLILILLIPTPQLVSAEVHSSQSSPTPEADFSSSWYGGVVVTSDQPVVAVGRPHIVSEATAYGGFNAGSNVQYVPMLFKNAWGSYNAALYIQNTSETNSTEVTVDFYNSSGGLDCSRTETISKLSSIGLWMPSVDCLPEGWVRGVVLTSPEPIVAVGRPHIGSQVMTYNGFSSGSLNAYIPMLFKSA